MVTEIMTQEKCGCLWFHTLYLVDVCYLYTV